MGLLKPFIFPKFYFKWKRIQKAPLKMTQVNSFICGFSNLLLLHFDHGQCLQHSGAVLLGEMRRWVISLAFSLPLLWNLCKKEKFLQAKVHFVLGVYFRKDEGWSLSVVQGKYKDTVSICEFIMLGEWFHISHPVYVYFIFNLQTRQLD